MTLREVWDERGVASTIKIRELGAGDIRNLLCRGRVRFVVANCGQPPNWVPFEDCYDFWKSEVKMRVAPPGKRRYERLDRRAEIPKWGYHLEDFPGEYCYEASE